MIRRKTLALSLAFATAIAGASALYAQTQEKGTGMMGMMQDCPMMHGMVSGPDAALEHKAELGLTVEQVEKLDAIQKRTTEGRRAAMERMKQIHQEIRAATDGERFDEAAARAAFDRMGDLHTEMGLATLRARDETRAVLTAEQRQKLDELGRHGMGMHGMMRGMQGMGGMHGMRGMQGGMEMMEHCPMMKGGMGHGSERHEAEHQRKEGA